MIPGLGLSAAELGQMRREQTALLPDLVEIRKPGKWTTIDGHSVLTLGAIAVTYNGKDQIPARVRPRDSARTDFATAIAAQDVNSRGYTITLPHDVTDSMTGLVVVPVASTDPYLAGKQIAELTEAGGAWVTGRRVTGELKLNPS